MPNLIVERGREKGQTVELTAGATVVIGRDPASAQFVISDAAASRKHFQLSQKNGKWAITDLGSKNATFLNEEKLAGEADLNSGDRIQVGETVFTFTDDQKVEDKSAGLSGRDIGGYKILDRIGRGGMGTVYKAKQVSLNRLVALKFLSPKLSKDPAFVEKFFAEARAAAQLNHPNVVQVFDVGTLGGVHYFSMEFMEGGCVQDLLSAREDSRLPWNEALPLIVDSVRGLVFAEKRGIIHRDIKPDNLMLTSEQKVKIGDLGLATSAEGGTEKGIFGTPHFIAPEQAQGKEVTHAADLYSMGATFYRVVAGRTPFSGQTVKDILRAQINDPHVPVLQIVPDFPPDLSAIIDKLMAKKVEDRYQSATKLLEDLEAFHIAHQIELAGGVKSRKPFLIALGIVGVAAGIAIWYALTQEPVEHTVERTTTVYEKIGTTGPVRTAEEIQEEKNRAAKSDFDDIEKRDFKLGTISLEHRAEWDQLQKDYDGLRAKHPEAEKYPAQAEKRAKEIRIALDELENTARTVAADAKKWWDAVADGPQGLKVLIGNDRWGDAIRRAKEIIDGEDLKKHSPYLTGPARNARAWLEGIPGECYDAATRVNTETLTKAESDFQQNDVPRALQAVEAWEKKVRDQLVEDPRWGLLADQAKNWRESHAKQAEEGLRAMLENDRGLFVENLRRVRPLTGDDRDALALYQFRFADAAKELRTAAEGRIKSWVYLDRVESFARRLETAQAALDGLIQLLAEKKLFAVDEEMKGLPDISPGTKASLDPEAAPSATGFKVVLRFSGGKSAKTFVWSQFTPDELHKVFVAPKLDRIAPELAVKLAVMFSMLSEADGAAACIDRGTPAGLTASEDFLWAKAEWAAMSEWDRLRSIPDTTPALTISRVDQWRNTHVRTDFFVSVDGRTGTALPEFVAAENVALFLKNYGVRPK